MSGGANLLGDGASEPDGALGHVVDAALVQAEHVRLVRPLHQQRNVAPDAGVG